MHTHVTQERRAIKARGAAVAWATASESGRHSKRGNMIASFILAFALVPLVLAQSPAGDIHVDAQRQGNTITLVVDMSMDATPNQVWDVLTDYGHMAEFLSTITARTVIAHHDNV